MKTLKLEHFIALGGKSQNMAQIEGFVFQSLENHPGRRRKLCLTKFSPSSSTMFTKAYNLRIVKKKKKNRTVCKWGTGFINSCHSKHLSPTVRMEIHLCTSRRHTSLAYCTTVNLTMMQHTTTGTCVSHLLIGQHMP